jgi:hypothetical protein
VRWGGCWADKILSAVEAKSGWGLREVGFICNISLSISRIWHVIHLTHLAVNWESISRISYTIFVRYRTNFVYKASHAFRKGFGVYLTRFVIGVEYLSLVFRIRFT